MSWFKKKNGTQEAIDKIVSGSQYGYLSGIDLFPGSLAEYVSAYGNAEIIPLPHHGDLGVTLVVRSLQYVNEHYSLEGATVHELQSSGCDLLLRVQPEEERFPRRQRIMRYYGIPARRTPEKMAVVKKPEVSE
jgi:hypothetical protein